MPKPVQFPAPPPVISAKGGKKSKKSKGSRKEGGEAAYPQGRKDALATSAAACLRFMSSCPGFVEQLMGERSLRPKVFSTILTFWVAACMKYTYRYIPGHLCSFTSYLYRRLVHP